MPASIEATSAKRKQKDRPISAAVEKSRDAAKRNRDRRRLELEHLEVEARQLAEENDRLREEQQLLSSSNREIQDRIRLITDVLCQSLGHPKPAARTDEVTESHLKPKDTEAMDTAETAVEASNPGTPDTPNTMDEQDAELDDEYSEPHQYDTRNLIPPPAPTATTGMDAVAPGVPTDLQGWVSVLTLLTSAVSFLPPPQQLERQQQQQQQQLRQQQAEPATSRVKLECPPNSIESKPTITQPQRLTPEQAAVVQQAHLLPQMMFQQIMAKMPVNAAASMQHQARVLGGISHPISAQ